MKIIDKESATDTLAHYMEDVGQGPVIVTDKGKPIAALISIENADLETVALSTNAKFIELMERSRARVRAEGSISSQEMRRRFSDE